LNLGSKRRGIERGTKFFVDLYIKYNIILRSHRVVKMRRERGGIRWERERERERREQ